MRFWGKC